MPTMMHNQIIVVMVFFVGFPQESPDFPTTKTAWLSIK
jgi:hypothetical protein